MTETDMNEESKLWIGRDKSGFLHIYTDGKPNKDAMLGIFCGDYHRIPRKMYPELTWENSPKELILNNEKEA